MTGTVRAAERMPAWTGSFLAAKLLGDHPAAQLKTLCQTAHAAHFVFYAVLAKIADLFVDRLLKRLADRTTNNSR